jgi:hypothetical protein
MVVFGGMFYAALLSDRGYDLRFLAWLGAPTVAFLTLARDYRTLWHSWSFWSATVAGFLAGTMLAAAIMGVGKVPVAAVFVALTIAECFGFDLVFRRLKAKKGL